MATLRTIVSTASDSCDGGHSSDSCAHQAGEQLRQAVNHGANWIVELDIEAFYDRIDHDLLMKLVEQRIYDRRVLKLLRQWLKAGVLDGGELLPSDQGVPQGGVISSVLANVVLHELDRLWEDRCSQLGQLIRYADDAVVLCRTEAQAREALWRVGIILTRLKLTLHPTKTQVVYVGDGRQGFDFLGFHCRKVESWKDRKYRYLQRWPGTASDAAHPRRDQSDHRSPTPLARTRRADRGPKSTGWSAAGAPTSE